MVSFELTMLIIAILTLASWGNCEVVPLVAVRASEAAVLPDLDVPRITSADQDEVCCEDLGCFSPGGPFFDPFLRPLSVNPSCAIRKYLQLHLNTRENPDKTQVLDAYNLTSISASNFKRNKAIKVLIHGYLDNIRAPTWTRMRDALLENDDCNVIRFDWSYGNAPPYYLATANTRLIGAYLAKFFLVILEKFGVDMNAVHIIGHSLGAHAAGYAGKYTQMMNGTKIGRITGLDPAGPNFSFMPDDVRLDPSDAKVVDTIISDGENLINPELILAYGSPQAMGHLNFFPNGGRNQPGCKSRLLAPPERIHDSRVVVLSQENLFISQAPVPKLTDIITESVNEIFICNHHRALLLFIDSIKTKLAPVKSYECESFEKYLNGECFKCAGGGCATMGFNADLGLAEEGKIKKYFTTTMPHSPFATQAQKVIFKLQGKTEMNNVETQTGFVYIKLKGRKGESPKMQLTKRAIKLEPGKTYSSFFEIPEDIGEVQSVVFTWRSERGINFLELKNLYLDGDIQVVDENEQMLAFRLARTKIREKDDVVAIKNKVTMTRKSLN